MGNYNKSGNGILKTVISLLLGVAIGAASLFGIAYGLNWLTLPGSNSEGSETVTSAGAVISDGESNGITLTSTTVSVANSTAESTYDLTATISPTYATNQTLTWSIAWDTSWSGYSANYDCEDVNSDAWTSDIKSVDISDYVSLSATTGSNITVSCWQPFGNPLIITVTTTDGSDLTATCKVDYQSYYKGLIITNLSSVVMSSSATSSVDVDVDLVRSYGTIAASGKLSYSVDTSEAVAYLKNNVDYTDADAWNYYVESSSEKNITSSANSIETLFYLSKNWTTFVTNLIDGNEYVKNDSSYTYSQYGTKALADFYNTIVSVGIENFHPFKISVSLVDNKTGEVFTGSTNFTFSSLSTYPTISVASLSIPSSITF